MNTIDIVIAVILLFGLVKGYIKGLFIEITSLVGLVLGVYGAIHFSYFLSDILKNRVSWDASMIQIVAFAGTFLIILMALVFLGKTLTKIAETVALGFFNKILGAIFGLLKYALILSIVFLVYDQINYSLKFINKKKAKQATLYEPVKNLAPAIFPSLVKIVEKSNQK
ncbi:MAG: CvpA family protein [Flavobacteriaceae bacterium]|nr:CvpA family protein [Flavobacteriaceae bacterium]